MTLLPSAVRLYPTGLLYIVRRHPGRITSTVGGLAVVDGKVGEGVIVRSAARFGAEALRHSTRLVETIFGIGKLTATRRSVRLVLAPVPLPGTIAVSPVGVEIEV